MGSVTTITPLSGNRIVARKKPAEELPSAGRPINFRAPPDLANRLDRVAEKLGLDVSNLVRMVLYENLSLYERRVKQLEDGSA